MVNNRIEVDPEIMLGKPIIRGTRIPVELTLRKLRIRHKQLRLDLSINTLKKNAAEEKIPRLSGICASCLPPFFGKILAILGRQPTPKTGI